MNVSLREVLEHGRTQLERLILSVLYQYGQTTLDKLKQVTGETKLSLYPTLRRLEERGLVGKLEPSASQRYQLTV